MNDWESPFSKIMKSDPSTWNETVLSPLKGKELAALCELMGIAHSGTREVQIERLLTAARLRTLLSEAEGIDDLLHYKGTELKQMCREAGIFLGVNKRSSAASLLNWRNQCRQKGQSALRKARENLKQRGRVQGRLKF